jgi:hypothetical protein
MKNYPGKLNNVYFVWVDVTFVTKSNRKFYLFNFFSHSLFSFCLLIVNNSELESTGVHNEKPIKSLFAVPLVVKMWSESAHPRQTQIFGL